MASPSKGTSKPSPSKSRQKLKLKDENTDEEKGLWTLRRTEILLECLEEAKAKLTGNVHGRAFAPKIKQIATAVKRHTGYDFDDSQVKNYWNRLKKTHAAFQRMQKQTGITVDVDEGRIIAEEHTWNDVLLPMSYTECKKIKEQGFPQFKRVDALVGDSRATGTRAHPSCISPSTSATGSTADPIEIKQEKLSEDEVMADVDSQKSKKKRKSLEKVKNLHIYDKGSSGSGSKKRNESFTTVFAESIAGLNQRLDYRQRSLDNKGVRGGSDVHDKEKEKADLTAVMQKMNGAHLTGNATAKALCLFLGDNGPGWVHCFLNLCVSTWEDTLASMPEPSPKKG